MVLQARGGFLRCLARPPGLVEVAYRVASGPRESASPPRPVLRGRWLLGRVSPGWVRCRRRRHRPAPRLPVRVPPGGRADVPARRVRRGTCLAAVPGAQLAQGTLEGPRARRPPHGYPCPPDRHRAPVRDRERGRCAARAPVHVVRVELRPRGAPAPAVREQRVRDGAAVRPRPAGAKYDVYEHGRWIKSPVARVYGGGGGKARSEWPDAMGIDWMTHEDLAQAIPPAYTEHIGSYLLASLRAVAA
jgi:hypothetical protein